jgi:hypothetical protein
VRGRLTRVEVEGVGVGRHLFLFCCCLTVLGFSVVSSMGGESRMRSHRPPDRAGLSHMYPFIHPPNHLCARASMRTHTHIHKTYTYTHIHNTHTHTHTYEYVCTYMDDGVGVAACEVADKGGQRRVRLGEVQIRHDLASVWMGGCGWVVVIHSDPRSVPAVVD